MKVVPFPTHTIRTGDRMRWLRLLLRMNSAIFTIYDRKCRMKCYPIRSCTMDHAGEFNFIVLSLSRIVHGFYSIPLFIVHNKPLHSLCIRFVAIKKANEWPRGHRSVKMKTVCAIQRYIHLNGNYFVKISNKLLYAGEKAIWPFKLN